MSRYYDLIEQSLRAPRARRYTPRFRIAREGRDWCVFDGARPIARFMPWALDIWAWSPFAPDIKANPEPPGKVVDIHTVHNTVINFGLQGWPKRWLAQGGFDAIARWRWLRKAGARLEALIEVDGPEGETGAWRLKVFYDPGRRAYRFTCDIHVRKRDPDGMEAFNLMCAGALEDRAAKRRWTHSVWENADGDLRRIVHSNALFCCTDYGGYRDGGGPWRGRHGSYPRAWIGYAAHATFNPVVLIGRSTVPLRFATCSQLFDEHIIWSDAGQDNLGPDGYFHYRLELEVVNVKADLARALLKQARDPVKPAGWHTSAVALPFHPERLNDCEVPVDPWQAEDCPILAMSETPDGPVQWVRGEAHSGRHSVRLTGADNRRTEVFPIGAVCKVRPHTRYRLSGWIKTRGVKRFARLELATFEYSYTNVIAAAESAPVGGSRGWTRVAVELDSGDEAYVLPRLVLYGPGTAWFDDFTLESV